MHPYIQLMGRFQAAPQGWQTTFVRLGLETFGILTLIQFVWAVAKAAFKSRCDFGEVGEVINQIIFIGLFAFLLPEVGLWAPMIIHSFEYTAGQLGGTPLAPENVTAVGVDIATKSWTQVSTKSRGRETLYTALR
jgi:type IV secretory pathway TrbL component